jgi:hypothetical protein
MENEYVPYEESMALKELGFDENCMGYYHGGRPLKFTYTEKIRNKKVSARIKVHNKNCGTAYLCTAPLWQQAFMWFRDKHGLFFNIISEDPAREDVYWFVWIFGKTSGRRDIKIRMIKTYQEAELACLKQLIEIVKEKGKDQLQSE